MGNKLYSLTNPQKSILLTEEFYKGSNINNICGTAIVDDILDFDLLKKAINLVVKNNDSFNLKLALDNNEVKQYLADATDIDVKVVNIDSKEDIAKIENELKSHVFDIYNGDLFDWRIFRLPNGTGGFMLNIHHLFADSWTLGLTAREVVRTYSLLVNGEDVSKNDDFSYVNYIYSEKEYLDSDKFKKDKEYWDGVFDTIPEQASIPGSKDEIANDFSSKANRQIFNIDVATMSKINEFCKDHNVSVFNFFIAIYSIYIGRVSNLEDFVVGTPILNRTNFKEKNTTGMFINTAPLRILVNNNLDFKSFVSNIAKDSLGMLRHQKYYYQNILEDLRNRDTSIPNLYNVLISYQVTKANTENGLSYNTRWAFNGNTADDMDIHLYDINDSGSIDVAYDYKVSKYEDSDIVDIHNRILHIASQILENNEIALKDIEIVTPEEKYEILYKFNDTDAEYPKDKTIIDLFEEQVQKNPDNIAIVFEKEKLTYSELNKKANQLAYFLRNFGIKPNDVVAIRLNRSLEMIVGIIGILKAGGCYLPIDLSYPQERVNFMISDSHSKIFLTNEIHKNDFEISIPTVLLDFTNTDIYTQNNDNLEIVNSPDDLIYIIYTSGSTGTPKGVMLTHRNIVRLIKNDAFLFDFSNVDIWTMFHSVAFDFSVWEMYGCLLYGGKLILVPEMIAKDPSLFLDLLRKERVTILNQTPTYFYNLLDMELLKQDSNLSIRYIIFGGEALKPNLIKPWKDKYPFTNLINMYGITETTVHVTFHALTDYDLLLPHSNIGSPIPTLKVYVMDNNLKLMPYGVEGEMCIAGLGLCKGYLNRPELNATRFEKNPYNDNEILYHSADSAILKKDGNLYYKGRIDNQVKIRGFRVELGEIEAKLLKHPDIIKCVVLPKQDNKDCHLIAYVIKKNNITSSELTNYISKLVPAYMVPDYFIFLDDIPLTSNGKINRKLLLDMKITIEKQTPYVAPRNEFEKVFIDILQNTLNIDNIGIDDNILQLGADSLTLMKITVELLEKKYTVNIQDIYEQKTVRNISDSMKYSKNVNINLQNNLYYDFDETSNHNLLSINNILLTGSTGYLGIHILKNLIDNTNCTVYCLIRDKNNVVARQRLENKLKFYFGTDMLSYLDSRIKVITGTLSEFHFSLTDDIYTFLGQNIDTVIHCAALVSHYGDKNLFNTINVVGTDNIITFCKQFDILLNHISTTSVAGTTINGINQIVDFDEHCLYIGQNYNDNIYIKSKFEAEYHIYSAMKTGLHASIYRLGNITARSTDGKFQENDTQNAFLNRIVAFAKLQKIPQDFANLSIDLSPVDDCSKIITSLLQYESTYGKVFHIFNNNRINVSGILEYLENFGKHIDIIPTEEFNDFISKFPMKSAVLGIINDITSNIAKFQNNVKLKNDFTVSYMKQYDLNWSMPDIDYLNKFLGKYIEGDEL